MTTTTIRFDASAGVYEIYTADHTWLAAFDAYGDARDYAAEYDMVPYTNEPEPAQLIEKYRGWKISRDENGFFAVWGVARDTGYCETLEEIRADVDWEIDRERDSELFRRGL